MKYIAYITSFVSMMLLGLLIVLCVMGRETRRDALERTLARTMEETLESCVIRKEDYAANTEGLLKNFEEAFQSSHTSDGTVILEIMQADIEKGILSVRAKEKFSYPNGKEGEISVFRTVICDMEMQEGMY